MKQKNLLEKLDNVGNLGVLSNGFDSWSYAYVYYFHMLPSSQYLTCGVSIEMLFSIFYKNEKYELLKITKDDTRNLSNAIFINKKKRCMVIFDENSRQNTNVQILCDVHNPPTKDIDYLFDHQEKVENPSYIYYITTAYGRLGLDRIEFSYKDTKIEDNYNEDFLDFHNNIIQCLAEKKAGVHILHGIPGTGKSSYIKYLINNTQKKFIYCPTTLVPQIASPDFLRLIASEGTNCVLIVEDAEDVLVDNGANRSSAISNLLNLSDGIIGDALNIQIITTFNVETNNIDPAILRKGRLLSMYEFKELNIDKSKKLLESLDIQAEVTHPMTLADIYHYRSVGYNDKDSRIGL